MNQYKEQLRNLYSGILNNYPEFAEGEDASLTYDLEAREWEELRSRYTLENVMKTGTAFERAVRLTRYLAPGLTHSSWYDNHVECNALELLAYSFENKEHGINCLNKAKILAECCLALGIYARRVFLYPFSPFDFDSHVVCEIFDERLDKWIMLDPTTDGYFVDENNTPLSMPEIRNGFTSSRFQTFVPTTGKSEDLQKTRLCNEGINLYFLKNCFRMSYELYNGFGKKADRVDLIPEGYLIKRNEELGHRFRIENMPEEYRHLLDAQEKYLRETNHKKEPAAYSVGSVYAPPVAR